MVWDLDSIQTFESTVRIKPEQEENIFLDYKYFIDYKSKLWMIEIEIGFTLYLYEIKDDLKHVLRLYTQLKTMRVWIHALLHISYGCMYDLSLLLLV